MVKLPTVCLIAILSLVVSGTASAEQGTWNYNIEHFPSTLGSPDECRSTATRLANQLVENTSASEARGRCLAIDTFGYKINIRYKAEARLDMHSTLKTSHALASRGMYSSRDECEAGLMDEVDQFVNELGKQPAIIPHCTREEFGSTPWMVRIEAEKSDEDARVVEIAGFMHFGRVVDHSQESFFAMVRDQLANYDYNVRKVVYESSLAYGTLSMFLYGNESFRVQEFEAAKLKTDDQCRAQLAQIKQLHQTYEIPAIEYCTLQGITGLYEVASKVLATESYTLVPSLELFDDYAACENQRDSYVSRRQDEDPNIFGGLCSYENGAWTIMMIEEPF